MDAKKATVFDKPNSHNMMPSTEDNTAVGVTLSVEYSSSGINTSFTNDRCNHPERPANSCLTDVLIRIGTDCSGMEAPIQAMRNLKLEFAHVFSCESDLHARKTIGANFPPMVFYSDITSRINDETVPETDVYVAGFPCQPFSSAGLGLGFDGQRNRGKISSIF